MSFFKVQNRARNGDKSNTRRFPSCLKPLFQSEAKCDAIDTNMILYSRVSEAHFQKKCCALSLVVYKPRELITKFLTIQHFLPFLTISHHPTLSSFNSTNKSQSYPHQKLDTTGRYTIKPGLPDTIITR